MAYQTLYRKYRPKNFKLVFGQDTIVKTLRNIIKKDKLSHAYLFTGPRGTGKTSCAKLFAKAINCPNNSSGDACNECQSCQSYNENSNPDIIEIDAASNNGVDEIREIKNKISLVPGNSKYKVYIIDEVHMLSIGAFNALLKTLEEPPEYVIFILATTEPQKLPATVISRCQRFDFKSISKIHMKDCLNNIISNENISIEEDALDEIVEISKGGLRDAIGLLDQAFAFSDDTITFDNIIELSGNISTQKRDEIIESILSSNYMNIIKISEELDNQGKDFYLVTEKILNFIRNILIIKKTNSNYNEHEKQSALYTRLNEEMLYKMINIFSNMLAEIDKSYYKKIIFEINLFNLIDILNILNNKKNEIDVSNVPRETLATAIENNNVPRGTLIAAAENNNVSRETSPVANQKNEFLDDLKNIRINNILKESTKEEISYIKRQWEEIKKYLLDSNYKMCAGVLVSAKPVAASNKGIIVTFPITSSVQRIEENYDISKELLSRIFNKKYKVVYITEKLWEELRPKYVEKAKNNMLKIIDEEEYIKKLNDKNNSSKSFDEFNDLIIVEGK